jgi:uncharacterized integral membrane protein (TIGR00697 family)
LPITRKQLVFFVLGGFFLTNALLGEVTGGKLFVVPPFELGFWRTPEVILPVGIIPWPVVFITTDLVNEYFGKGGVRRLTFLAVAMISYSFAILYLTIPVPAWERSPVSDAAFGAVFGQSMWIIVGSVTAFLVSQLVDVVIFHFVRQRTGHRLLWLRATGSTFISQLVDTFLVQFIAFYIPGKLTMPELTRVAAGSYLYKLLIAILITPLIYLAHNLIDRFLEHDAEELQAAERRG